MKRQIPNMLSCLRLLMIPIFVVCYFKYSSGSKTAIAATVYLLAWLTDALDGYLARRNNWITDLGKILDPLADKLMQLTAAICFAIENSVFYFVAIPLFIKEFVMTIAAIKIKRQKNIVVAASWYGKVATVLLFICAFLRIVIRNNPTLDIFMALFMLSCMIFSLVMYYFKIFKGKYDLTIINRK